MPDPQITTSAASLPPACPMCGSAFPSQRTTCPRCGEPANGAKESSKRFRWRVIPAFLLGLMAGFFSVCAVLECGVRFFLLAAGKLPSEKAIYGSWNVVHMLVLASVLGGAARFWWQGRWWWAVGGTALGYVAGALGFWLLK